MTEWEPLETIGCVQVYRRAGDVVRNGRRFLGHEYRLERDGKVVATIEMMHHKDARAKYNAMAAQQRTIERMKA